MPITLNPYLQFTGETRAAMEFYRGIFGGTLELSTYAEMGMSGAEANDDRIMHSMLVTDHGLVVMAADAPEGQEEGISGISLSLSGDDDATLTGYYEALADSGKAVEPLEAAPWGDKFGMCIDRFGVAWMVNISGTAA